MKSEAPLDKDLFQQTRMLLSVAIESVKQRCISFFRKNLDEIHRMMQPDPESISYLPALLNRVVTPEFRDSCDRLGATFGIHGPEDHRMRLKTLFVAAIESFYGPTLPSHFDTVGELCRSIAVELGIRGQEAEEYRIGGSLHDVGKLFAQNSGSLGVPFRVRYLTMIRLHPDFGALLMRAVSPLMDFAIPFALEHHERFDGTGFPRGLTKSEMTLQAEVTGLADGYDAKMMRWQEKRETQPTKREVIDEVETYYQKLGFNRSAVLKAFLRVVDRDHYDRYPPQ